MTLQEDLEAKRPGEWTQEDIRDLQRKHRRTHFTHFSGQTSPLYRKNYDRIFRRKKADNGSQKKGKNLQGEIHQAGRRRAFREDDRRAQTQGQVRKGGEGDSGGNGT